MQSKDDPAHKIRIKKVAYKLNMPEELIEQALFYTSEYIKGKISKIVLDQDKFMTKEEFEKTLPTVKLPSLGYLQPSYYKYKYIYAKQQTKKKLEEQKEKEKELDGKIN